jgi:chromosome segregation ATPase
MYKQKIAVLRNDMMHDDLKSKRVSKQNDDLYKRLKVSENQNQNLIQLIKELENKIITLEKELGDTEAMVSKETNLRVELEAEIRRLNDRIRFLEDMNQKSGSETDLRYQNQIQAL